MVSTRASSAQWALRFRTAVRPSWRQVKWSIVRNSTCYLIAATRCPVMIQDVVQFSGAVSIGSSRASPACFTGRQVKPLHGDPYPNPLNMTGKKVTRSAFLTGSKASPMPGVTHYTNAHS